MIAFIRKNREGFIPYNTSFFTIQDYGELYLEPNYEKCQCPCRKVKRMKKVNRSLHFSRKIHYSNGAKISS